MIWVELMLNLYGSLLEASYIAGSSKGSWMRLSSAFCWKQGILGRGWTASSWKLAQFAGSFTSYLSTFNLILLGFLLDRFSSYMNIKFRGYPLLPSNQVSYFCSCNCTEDDISWDSLACQITMENYNDLYIRYGRWIKETEPRLFLNRWQGFTSINFNSDRQDLQIQFWYMHLHSEIYYSLASIRSSSNLQDAVTVVGYPLGGETISVSKGVISRIEVCSRFCSYDNHKFYYVVLALLVFSIYLSSTDLVWEKDCFFCLGSELDFRLFINVNTHLRVNILMYHIH